MQEKVHLHCIHVGLVSPCQLAVDSCLIDFGAHVVGQNISRYITLNNRGALGTNFALVPVAYLNPAETQNLTQSPAQVQAQISSQAFSCSTQVKLGSQP